MVWLCLVLPNTSSHRIQFIYFCEYCTKSHRASQVGLNIEHDNVLIFRWYLKKFDNYPKDRKAVIPFLL